MVLVPKPLVCNIILQIKVCVELNIYNYSIIHVNRLASSFIHILVKSTK